MRLLFQKQIQRLFILTLIVTMICTTPAAAASKNSGNKYLGVFKIYAYSGSGTTASGTKTTNNRTIAVDPKVIPLGSKVVINGKTYIAEDTGGAIKGNVIDVYMSSEQKCREWGVKKLKVYLKK